MTDLQTAKRNLEGHTICLCKDGHCLYSEQKGIAPMMRFIAVGTQLNGYAVADTVVGKAAAMLFVKCGIAAVYAKVLSRSAQAVLQQYNIPCEYETLTQKIVNRAGTDMCPMEKTVLHTNDIEQAYTLLQQTLRRLTEQSPIL